MFGRDDSAITVALAAALLAGTAWALDGWTGPAVSDRAGLDRASRQALEGESMGSPVVWRDSDASVTAVITPSRAFRSTDGRWCRSYDIELAADGQHPRPPAHHVACRDGAGSWSRLAEPHPGGTALHRWFDRLTSTEQVAGTGG
jgi:surface antigen